MVSTLFKETIGGGRRVKWVKGVNCMVRDGNETFCGTHIVMCTDVEL